MEAQGTGVHIVMSPWNSVLLSMVFSPSRQLPRKLLQSIWELQYCVDSVLQRQSGSLHSCPGLWCSKKFPSKYPLPILSVAYHSRQLTFRRNQISQWLMHEHSQLREEVDFRKSEGEAVDNEYFSSRVATLKRKLSVQRRTPLPCMEC
jgi:fatty acid synthase subunit alpha